MYGKIIKRIIDFIISLIAFILLSPFFFLIMIILMFSNGGKAFFTQKRPGKNGKIFKIVKFKTMNDNKDSEGNILPAIERITPMGSFVRKTSLDEIPQLLNVIKGDMSLIGPRPLRVEYLPLYTPEQSRRHEVRPGITGWAQVNGRNAISWEKKFDLDVYYVDNISFKFDLKIILMTLKKIIKRENINSDNNHTMVPFKNVKLNG